MELVKLGRKGQVSIPAALMRRLGLEGDSWLIADVSEDGALVLRPAGVYQIEICTDERIKEFEEEGRITDEEWERVQRLIKRR